MNKLSAAPRPTSIDRVLLNARIGKAVRTLRLKTGKGVGEIASAAGMTYQTFSKVESGDYPPSVHNLVAIARVFGVTLNDIVPMEET